MDLVASISRLMGQIPNPTLGRFKREWVAPGSGISRNPIQVIARIGRIEQNQSSSFRVPSPDVRSQIRLRWDDPVLAFRSWLDLGSDQARCEKFSLGNWWAEPVPDFKSRGTGSSKSDELSKINRLPAPSPDAKPRTGEVGAQWATQHVATKPDNRNPGFPARRDKNRLSGGWKVPRISNPRKPCRVPNAT